MSRASWVSRKPGSRFLSIFAEDVERFGLAGAAILAMLDFFDRANSVSGLPTASRERIIVELQGVVGRNAIDKAIKQLVELGLVHKNEKTEFGQRNFVRIVRYGLNAAALTQLLRGTPETGSSGSSRNREFQELPKSGMESGTESGVPSLIEKNLKEEAEEGAASSAAPIVFFDSCAKPVEVRFESSYRNSGIHVWTVEDRQKADDLIQNSDPADLREAVAAVEALREKNEPLPGRVERQLATIARKKKTRRPADVTKNPPKAQIDLDSAAQAKGRAFFKKGLPAST